MEHVSIIGAFLENAQKNFFEPIIKYRPVKGGPFTNFSWGELKDAAKSFALGLLSLDLEPEDRVAILAFNRLEWIVADLGSMMAGGVDVPIYHTNTPDQCAYILNDSGARFLVVEDLVQLYKIQLKLGELKHLEKIILMEGLPPEGDESILTYAELLERGKAGRGELAEVLSGRIERISSEDMATIVYTSGTTGPPKGCMVSHGNTLRVLESIDKLIRIDPAENLSLLILPLSHFYPRVSGYYYNIFKAVPLAIAESINTLAQDMNDVQPTYFCCVPRVLEKVQARITGNAEKGSFVKRRLFRWALDVGRQRSRLANNKAPMSKSLAWQFKRADRLVFQRIRERLGGRLRFAVSAGAPLSADVGEFVDALGVQVIEFYGLTETLGGTMTTFDECRYGTVGKPMPGFEIQLAPDGEILIQGNNFMGYFNQPDMTDEVLRDGWCYTGDVGRWDDDGFLIITDRKKDLIITSGGKNISPQNLENVIKEIPLVANALVYGDRRKYLSALITLDPDSLAEFAAEKNIDDDSLDAMTRHPEINALIDREMERINGKLAPYETIKKYTVLDRDFTQEEGEITPTLKLKRKVIVEKYQSQLESMYEADEV